MPKGTGRPTKRRNKPGTDKFAASTRAVVRQDRQAGQALARGGLSAPGLRKRERIKRGK